MHKFTRAMIAGLIATVGTAANASYFVNFGSVTAEGTVTTSTVSYACTSNCPVIVSPYTTFVNGLYGGMSIANLDGVFSFTGQDRSRGSFTVDFEFANGNLLSTSLTGYQELTRCLSIPCTASHSNFGATNFALQVRDERTGISALMAPVPEPASWAMLLMGFASIGYALRRRRRAAASMAPAR